MDIRHQLVVFDAADIAAESAFWAGVLGGVVDSSEADWHTVRVAGEPRVAVQLAPDHVAPDWPGGSPPQQVHLDLWVEVLQAAHDELVGLGARVLKHSATPGPGDDSNFQVYADPAGHPFCVCWALPPAGD